MACRRRGRTQSRVAQATQAPATGPRRLAQLFATIASLCTLALFVTQGGALRDERGQLKLIGFTGVGGVGSLGYGSAGLRRRVLKWNFLYLVAHELEDWFLSSEAVEIETRRSPSRLAAISISKSRNT